MRVINLYSSVSIISLIRSISFLLIMKEVNGQILNDTTVVGKELDHSKNSKLFPFVFAVLKIQNIICQNNEDDMNGICYLHQECTKLGGLPTTKCAEGFGTCCIFITKCSSTTKVITIKRNITHIITPTQKQQNCRYVIPRQPGICQLRLDFNQFSLGDSVDGNCLQDSLTINGGDNLDKFIICGKMESKSHIYVHYGDSESISLNINLLKDDSVYNIQVSMIKCDDMEKAPDGCTQYYTEETSKVQSFNFPQQQLNGQKYMICIKSIPGSSEIIWTTCSNQVPTTSNDFFISGDGEKILALGGNDCTRDYIAIHDSQLGRYCGSSFTGVESKAKPYLMWVNFNEEEFIGPPSGPINPNSGCPYGWICTETNSTCTDDMSTCQAPDEIEKLSDSFNTGFCLRYNVK